MTTAEDRYRLLDKQPFVSTASVTSLAGTVHSLREILRHREMLGLLVRRDLKSRYKDSALGFVWTLIRPLTQLVIYYVVVGKFLQAERGIPEFAVYIFAGLTAYSLFSEIIGSATSSIVGNAGLIKKVYLPREVFPIASVGSALFNFAMQLVILVVATVVTWHVPLHVELLYAIPGILVLVVYGLAFGLLLSAVNVYLRDIGYLVEVLLLLLLWASPIVYAWRFVRDVLGNGPLLEIYTDNPVTLSVLAFQKAFWTSSASTVYPDLLLARLIIAFVVGLVLLVVFQRVFSRLQGNFAQEL